MVLTTKFRSRYSIYATSLLLIAIVLLTCFIVTADPDANHDELVLPRNDIDNDLLDLIGNEEEDTETPYEEVFDFDLHHYRDDGSEDNVIPIHPSILNEMETTASEFTASASELESEERKRCENLRDVLINKGNFTELIHKRFALSYKTTPHIPFSGVYRRAFGVKRFAHKLVHSTAIEKSDLRVMSVNPVVGLCVLESNLTLRSRKTNHTESDVKHVLVFKSWGKKYAGARIYDYNPEAFMKMVKLYTTAAERNAWKLASAIYSKGYKSKRVRNHLYQGTEIVLNTVGYTRHDRQIVFRGRSAIRKAADWAVENLWKPHMGPNPRPKPKPKPKYEYDDYAYEDEEEEIYDTGYGYDDVNDEELELTRNHRHATMYVADEDDMVDVAEYIYPESPRATNRGYSNTDDEEDYDFDDADYMGNDWRRRRHRRHHHHHHHHHNLRKLLKTTFPLGLPFTPHWCDIHASNDTHIAGSCFFPPIMRRHKHILPPFIVGEIYLNAPQVRFTMEFTSCGKLHRLVYTPLQPTPIHGYWNHEKKKDDDKKVDEVNPDEAALGEHGDDLANNEPIQEEDGNEEAGYEEYGDEKPAYDDNEEQGEEDEEQENENDDDDDDASHTDNNDESSESSS